MLNVSINVRKLAFIIMAKEIDEKVFEFFLRNSNPTDAQVHTFAEKENIDVHDIEKAIYKLATMHVRLKTEGLSVKKKFTEKDADPKQLKMGIKVEHEHINDDDVAKKIALDHLAEIPDYYTRLDKMEKEAEK